MNHQIMGKLIYQDLVWVQSLMAESGSGTGEQADRRIIVGKIVFPFFFITMLNLLLYTII